MDYNKTKEIINISIPYPMIEGGYNSVRGS
jgi:hypothetical protein